MAKGKFKTKLPGLDGPAKPPAKGAAPRDWSPGQGTPATPRQGGRGTNMSRKYATDDQARNI